MKVFTLTSFVKIVVVRLRQASLSAVVISAGIFLGAPIASAQITVNDGCMQDLAGFALGCTANDVQIAAARDIAIIDDGCAYQGDTVDFTATFDVVVTAKERFDIGLYFATDGDPNGDGAKSGECSVSTPPYQPDPPFLDLDGTNDDPNGVVQDMCGDINKRHNPLQPTITLTDVACVDPDGDGKLNLPNCTSWRQSGANELCLSPLDAFPGSPSKCRCDLEFNIDIDVPPAELTVTKTATPSSVDEPGGNVVFTVTLTNPGVDPGNSLTIDSLTDDVFGNLNGMGTCAVPQTLAGAGGTYSCTFTGAVTGNVGDLHTDTVSASGVDSNGNELSGSDFATVEFDNVAPEISVTKTANPTEVLEPGGNVTFSITVVNDSVSSDPVTIDSLSDSIYGDISAACGLPRTLAGGGGSFSCSFTEFVGASSPTSETDVVTASGFDDEGTPVSGSDDATVDINDVPSAIEIIKTANPTSVDEPGADVLFTFAVSNDSLVDAVTINSLEDTVFGDLDGQGTCSVPQTIAALGSYSCAATFYVAGNPATDEPHMNVVTASGIDDDGNPVSDDDSATVSFNNVLPDASLVKTAESVVVTYKVEVTNESTAEDLTLTLLTDDQFGNLNGKGTCAVPQTIAIGGSYTCTFDGAVDSSPHTNEATGTVVDDEASPPVTPKDTATVTFQ